MGCVQGLDQVSCVTQEHGVAGGSNNHTDHGKPDVTHALWRVSAISYAQHVTHGHEQGIRVLDVPGGVLRGAERKEEGMKHDAAMQSYKE